jgi:hypothetical protein
MIAPARKTKAADALAIGEADAPKTDEVIKSKKPRLRGRARAKVAQVIEGPSSKKPVGLSAGTKLTRTYKGKRITVVVMEKGFEFEGSLYRSLSAIANKITGSHVSGNAWFGLRVRKEKKS